MGKSSNGYVPKGLHHNKVWSTKYRLAPLGDASPQYRTTLGVSPRTSKIIPSSNGVMVLSPRQQRKQARLLALADEQARNLALLDRQRAADRATINAERGAIAAKRRDKAEARLAGEVTKAVELRDKRDGMAWFIKSLNASLINQSVNE